MSWSRCSQLQIVCRYGSDKPDTSSHRNATYTKGEGYQIKIVSKSMYKRIIGLYFQQYMSAFNCAYSYCSTIYFLIDDVNILACWVTNDSTLSLHWLQHNHKQQVIVDAINRDPGFNIIYLYQTIMINSMLLHPKTSVKFQGHVKVLCWLLRHQSKEVILRKACHHYKIVRMFLDLTSASISVGGRGSLDHVRLSHITKFQGLSWMSTAYGIYQETVQI